MIFRNLLLKIKRWLFYKTFGFYPVDIKRLVYVQKSLEHRKSKYQNYNDYLKNHFNKKEKI